MWQSSAKSGYRQDGSRLVLFPHLIQYAVKTVLSIEIISYQGCNFGVSISIFLLINWHYVQAALCRPDDMIVLCTATNVPTLVFVSTVTAQYGFSLNLYILTGPIITWHSVAYLHTHLANGNSNKPWPQLLLSGILVKCVSLLEMYESAQGLRALDASGDQQVSGAAYYLKRNDSPSKKISQLYSL